MNCDAMIIGRELSREEIKKFWTIDRSEVIEAVYSLERGALVLRPAYFDARGWPPGEAEKYTPILEVCHDQGGWFYGLFDAEQLTGVAVLESRFIGTGNDQLQLKFLHISRPYRHRGLGRWHPCAGWNRATRLCISDVGVGPRT